MDIIVFKLMDLHPSLLFASSLVIFFAAVSISAGATIFLSWLKIIKVQQDSFLISIVIILFAFIVASNNYNPELTEKHMQYIFEKQEECELKYMHEKIEKGESVRVLDYFEAKGYCKEKNKQNK